MQTKVVFQSGMSWKVVEGKWPIIREAFHDFQIGAGAAIDETADNALADDKRAIRNGGKLQAITGSAWRMIELGGDFDSVQKYLRLHDSFLDLVKIPTQKV